MNSKRQTIWLVSMLSLMVVLSAYYLFTDNVDQLDTVTGKLTDQQGTGIKADQTGGSDNSAGGQSAGSAAAGTGKQNSKDSAAAQNPTSKDSVGTAMNQPQGDEQILKKIESQPASSQDYFTSLHMKRDEEMNRQSDQLMAIIGDTTKSADVVSKAYDDMQKLEDKQAKISNIEQELLKDYADVFVSESGSKWSVLVKSDKLQKSQAVSIVDLMTGELKITPNNVVVKYMK
ncbi:SpoIIIAH-like family protein [Ferviditalea candida]|uniref:SpoIIIAH-like family protein n=1 Tax=Ferviditalea candida TaxID=3108399 RepID=A0ABU5ZK33_9BACL|nr:SpoIIIAH-like family protein [Paenibacillaceae bacterium T2]